MSPQVPNPEYPNIQIEETSYWSNNWTHFLFRTKDFISKDPNTLLNNHIMSAYRCSHTLALILVSHCYMH